MHEVHTQPLPLRVEEAAKILAVSKSKLYELIRAGLIPHIRIGRSLRVPIETLRNWIEKKTTRASGGGL